MFVLDDLEDGEKSNGEIIIFLEKQNHIILFNIRVCVKSSHKISISFFVFFILYL